MHSQTRIVVILATALVGAVVAAGMSGDPSLQAPGQPAAAAVRSTPGTPELPLPTAAGVVEPDPSDETQQAPTSVQRTEVEVSPSGRRVPISNAERVRIRAAALATKLELSATDEAALLTVLLEEQTRRTAALTELRRKPDDAEVNARARTEFDAILAWKSKALRDQFGAERAEAMMKRR